MKEKQVKVWDLAVRIFHWSLVVAFITAYVSGEEESDVHVYAGYIVMGLVAFRLLWGLIGSRHARFKNFVRGPQVLADYLRSLITSHPKHYLGHNPAGGWMVVALLVSLLMTGYTGLEVYGAEGHGPLTGQVYMISAAVADDDHHEYEEDNEDEDAEEFWEEIHEAFANFTLFLIVVHVLGVLVSSYLHRENLVKAMVTGRKTEKE